jgi:hypothetical protein
MGPVKGPGSTFTFIAGGVDTGDQVDVESMTPVNETWKQHSSVKIMLLTSAIDSCNERIADIKKAVMVRMSQLLVLLQLLQCLPVSTLLTG